MCLCPASCMELLEKLVQCIGNRKSKDLHLPETISQVVKIYTYLNKFLKH